MKPAHCQFPISDFRLLIKSAIRPLRSVLQSAIGNRQSAILLLLLLLPACSSVSYTRTEPGGEKVSFTTQSLFTRKAIKDVEYTAGIGTNGLRRFNLKGYSNNQTEAIREAIAAALEAYSNRPTPPANPK